MVKGFIARRHFQYYKTMSLLNRKTQKLNQTYPDYSSPDVAEVREKMGPY